MKICPKGFDDVQPDLLFYQICRKKFTLLDRQGLEQAVLISNANKINIENIEAWAIREGMKEKFVEFKLRPGK